MKITRVEGIFRSLQLSEPYAIAYDSVAKSDTVFIHIETDTKLHGWGCASPDPHVTGESALLLHEQVDSVIGPLLQGREVFEYGNILESLKRSLPDHPGSRCMVDMALYDLIAQKAGVPLYKLLGGYKKKIATSVTIGILPVEDTIRRSMMLLNQGFRILKIKGGRDLPEDIERINRVREAAGKSVTIRFDANQGYTLEESLRFIEGVRESRIELLEQPTKRGDFGILKTLTSKSEVPVMADESLLSLTDAFHLSRDHCTDLVNIKLLKTGGIMDAMHINSVTRAAGIGAMVGCMDESALGIAAGLHFALSRPNIRYADLDGHLDLMDDPFRGMLRIEEGELFPPVGSGLGWGTLPEFRS